jgi:hypothetical protein
MLMKKKMIKPEKKKMKEKGNLYVDFFIDHCHDDLLLLEKWRKMRY